MSKKSKWKRLEQRRKTEQQYLDELARIRAKAATGTTKPLSEANRDARAHQAAKRLAKAWMKKKDWTPRTDCKSIELTELVLGNEE